MSVAEKAARLLVEGRVTVLEAGRGSALALVVGDHGEYAVTVDAGHVVCPCPAWTGRCSHARAVELVVSGRA